MNRLEFAGNEPSSAPPPPNAPPRIAPRRRENAVQPPALTTTSLSGVRYQGAGGGYLPTPTTSTSTSMASPFIPSSSAPLSGLASPMASHHHHHHHHAPYVPTTPYNPQEWGPIGGVNSSPTLGIGVLTPVTTPASASRGISALSEDANLPPPPPPHPPPPPYSPPRSGPPQSTSSNTSPTYLQNNASSSSRPRPSSMIHSRDLPSADHPPPPASGSTSRPVHGSSYASSSRSHGLHHPSNVISAGRLSPEVVHYGNPADPTPPSSRRAASTGDIESRGTQVNPRSSPHANSRRWTPGMPIPPPPPGPPPGSSPCLRRTTSQEPSRSHFPSGGSTRERTRQAPALGTTLPSIPPTPADWVDSDSSTHPQHSTARDTSRLLVDDPLPSRSVSDAGSENSSGRAANAKGIRERRIETRLGRTETAPTDDHPPRDSSDPSSWPADLVLGSPGAGGSGGLVRRRTVTKATPRTPRSARSNPSDEPRTGTTASTSPFGLPTSSTGSFPTPKQQQHPPSECGQQPQSSMQTPPFSPGRESKSPPPVTGEVSRHIPQKALPTPPLVQHDASPNLSVSPGQNNRPVSHLLHLPIDTSPTHAPLVPKKQPQQQQAAEEKLQTNSRDETFLQEAERRYHDFLSRELEAQDAAKGLKMFCDFVISESAIRRKRYDSVWTTGSFDRERLVSKLFEPPCEEPEDYDTPPAASQAPQPAPVPSSPTPSSAQPKPAIKYQLQVEPPSWNQYRPTLSPIASMSMSNDEMSSRGRAPSRWWESQTGSESGGGGNGPNARSRRETKYMGLPREMREAMQLGVSDTIPEHEVDQGSFPLTNPFAGGYGPNEYPPEKVGWHDDQQAQKPLVRAPSNSREKLDISRLITLPPPYPRHYPAVNNNHPDLSFYRSTVRSVSDLSELQTTKENYELKIKDLREKHEQKLQDERRSFRAGVNRGIEEGSISYAEAAEAEAIRRTEEHDQEKELVQAEFDLYQERVFKPMRSILCDRVNIVSTGIDELRGKLFDSAQHETPNQTQEGGDEQPELLEKLTQLKWLFEARENLYREEFNLQSEQSEKYRALVTLPYHQTKNREKIQETDGFFTRDSQDQQVTFAAETLRRFESFMDVIEDNVARGVETQLSAFWDIAPSLLDLLQEVPRDDLRGFAVKIPQKEYDETPSYYRFPLQYLYSLLTHSEKSTYQFIESQTNLFCLLHEVKSGLMNANCLVMELQRLKSGEDPQLVRGEMRETRDEGERALTADLKDKVGMVEEQWAEALGKLLEDVKGTVQDWLIKEGGWEEMMQLDA